MGTVICLKFLLLCLVLLTLQLDVYQCGRWGGGGSSSSYGWSNPSYTTPPTYPSYLYYNQFPNKYSYRSYYPYYQYSQPYNYNRYPIPSKYPLYYPQIRSSTSSPFSTYGWLSRSPSQYPSWSTTASIAGSTPQPARYGWGRPSYTTPSRYPSYPALRQSTTPATAYRNPSPTRYSGFHPQSSTSSPSRYGWQGRPANGASYPIRSTTPSPFSSRPGHYGGRSFGGSRSSFGGSRSSYSGSRPSISSPSFSSRPSSSWGSSKPSYGWSISRPSFPSSSTSYGWSFPSSKPSFSSNNPSRPPSYGWNIPSRTPSKPSTSFSPSYGRNIPTHTPSKPSTSFSPSRPSTYPSYGWNTPSSKPSFSPNKPTSTATSSYGWNLPSSKPSLSPSGPSRPQVSGGNPSSQSRNPPAYNKWNAPSSSSSKPSSTSSSSSRSTAISSSPSKPPAYGWNTGSTNSRTSSPWAVPGRESPYYMQNTHANSHQPSAPPNKGTIGWNPSVTNTVASGAPRNYNSGTQMGNKRVIGSTSTGFNKPYPQQQYAPGHQSYYQPGARPGTYGYQPPTHYGGGHTTIINNNNYHSYPSYGSYSYYRPPVYYPSYHYTYHDTGSTALGFYLGYSLGHMHTPTYHYYHHHVHDTYRPVYDHYTVHYYNHYHESAPKHEEIPPNIIRECIGDSRIVCPQNTYALCTNSGSIMCVAQATSTVPCSDVKQTNCVRSYVPCVNNTAPECRGKTEADKAEVSIPCIYTTKVMGNITFVNNTIVLEQQPEMESNSTSNFTISTWNAAANAGNSSTATTTTTATTTKTTTVSTLTTLPDADTSATTKTPPETSRSRREASGKQPAQAFCVTIVAQPAERKNLTENELLFQDTKNLFHKFATKAFGLS